jgi:hypothetical protein
VRRELPSSARHHDGSGHRDVGAQPREATGRQLALAVRRAEPKGRAL